MAPYVPKYVRPEDAAASRAQMKRRLIWIAVLIPLAFAFLMYGYSDMAPGPLRNGIITLDRALGYPILWLIDAIAR